MSNVDILKQTKLFCDLDQDVLKALAGHAIEKQIGRDEILFIAGEPADGLYVIASGAVRAFRSASDGREQVIHVERAVTTIAEVPVFDDGNYPSTVAAEEDSNVLFLKKADILKVCLEYPQLALAAARLLATRLRNCAELVETLSLREVGQRLAKLILEDGRTRGVIIDNGLNFVQKLTHNQLAARIGTVREVVTRAMLRLQAQGLVIIEGKKVKIPNIEALRAYADQS